MPRPPAPHGTTNRYRGGCNCDDCIAAHTADTVAARRVARSAALAPHRETILERLTAGYTMPDAVEGTGLTQQAVYGIAKWDSEWSALIDQAMMEGRPDGVPHGTPTGARSGCHCPECRAAKNGK